MRLFAESVKYWAIRLDPKGSSTHYAEKSDNSLLTKRFDDFFGFEGDNHSSERIGWFESKVNEFLIEKPWSSEESNPELLESFDASRAKGADQFRDLGYKGEYVVNISKKLLERYVPRTFPEFWPDDQIRKDSQELMIERQRGDLEAFGVQFDTWFSEQSLHDRGIVAEKIEGLKATGVADEEPYRTKLKLGKGGKVEETIREDQPNEDEGEEETANNPQPTSNSQSTLWLRSTLFGDDMDRVLRRRDGRLTYIASDVAYHEDKLSRPPNATKLITILGPDHHGYIGRLTAVMAALLRGPEATPEANALALTEAREKLEVVIYQLVRFLKDGQARPHAQARRQHPTSCAT